MNEQLIAIIESLKDNFTYGDTESYENLLLIIYNSMFLDEDNLTSDIKYKIFETLSTIVDTINKQQVMIKNSINKEDNLTMMEKVLIPFYMKDGVHSAARIQKEMFTGGGLRHNL